MMLSLWILLLLDSGQYVLSTVITGDLPTELSTCQNTDHSKVHDCVLSSIKTTTEKLGSNEDIPTIVVEQTFYWHPAKRVRRECRVLSKQEREELWAAINALKQDTSKEPNVYDWFANLHSGRALYSVHFGPNFFGWHRIYNLRFEELLRKKNPNVTVCYWDSRVDQAMRRPPLSTMLSPRFLGNPWGKVFTGPFGGWKTITGKELERDLGAKGSFIARKAIDQVLSQESHQNISNPTAYDGFVMEDIHNNIHAAIGGQMGDFATSSQDPAFWIHHAFIDAVWEKFCAKMRMKGKEPQDDYVTKWVSQMQMPDKYMDRFSAYKNLDGYSYYFTKNVYQYEDFPKCENNCWDSQFMRCSMGTNECVGREKFEDFKEKDDLPRKYRNDLSGPLSETALVKGQETIQKYVIVPIKIIFRTPIDRLANDTNVGCDDDISICSKSVAILQSRGITYSGIYTDYINADVSIPIWTYAFVAVKNPDLGPSSSFVSLFYKHGGLCQPMCLDKNEDKYSSCQGVVNVTTSDQAGYFPSFDAAEKEGFNFDPLADEEMDTRIKLKFVCSQK